MAVEASLQSYDLFTGGRSAFQKRRLGEGSDDDDDDDER